MLKTVKLKTRLPLMTTKSMVKSAWAEHMGQFFYQLDLDTKITRRLEKIKLKIINSVPSSFTTLVYIYIYIVVNGEFFLSLNCQHPGNLFQ